MQRESLGFQHESLLINSESAVFYTLDVCQLLIHLPKIQALLVFIQSNSNNEFSLFMMDVDGEGDGKGYRWETEYEKTWEAIRETEGGLLQPSIDEIARKAKRVASNALKKRSVRLGIMRHLYLVIDMSESMLELDLKPSRFNVTLKIIESFLTHFFDQNPISQVGIITTSNKRSTKLVELNASLKVLLDGLKKLNVTQCLGEASLQNSLEMCLMTMKNLPKHTSKEVLIIMGSLTTCDPSDINTTIKTLVGNNVRVSIIGLSAEVHVCKRIAKETKGSYQIILDEHHLQDLVNQYLSPPPASSSTESSLIRMGFPPPSHESVASMCVCHLKTEQTNFSRRGYFCPQCNAKYCDLPVECSVCSLTLISSAHLARSYHHLFPIQAFQEQEQNQSLQKCFSCPDEVTTTNCNRFQCPSCEHYFCSDCDSFIHESLHVCPGCASIPTQEEVSS